MAFHGTIKAQRGRQAVILFLRSLRKIQMATITLKYFNLGNLGSRGGAVRIFFLAHGIKHTDEWIDFGTWADSKRKIIESGENPAGFIPIVHDGDKTLIEHHAIVRYYARQVGVYGKDSWVDFVQDAIAEAIKDWRAAWVSAALGDDKIKSSYAASLPTRYETLEKLLKKYGGLGNLFSIGDAMVFSQIYDDRNLGNKLDLASYPLINAVIKKGLSFRGIKTWCDDHGKPF